VFKQYFKNEKIYFALKSNSNAEVIKTLHSEGSNFECASIGEVDKLLSLKVPVNRIIYSNPVISNEEIAELYNIGVRYFVFENIETLKELVAGAPKSKYCLRINLHEHNKEFMDFGATTEYIASMVKENPELCKNIQGLTFYGDHALGLNICSNIITKYLPNIKVINLGGRFHVYSALLKDLSNCKKSDSFNYFIDKIDKIKKDLGVEIMLEPGESMLHDVGYAITKIKYVNDSNADGIYYHIDSGPSLGLNQDNNEVLIYPKNKENNNNKNEVVGNAIVCDPTCLKQIICVLKQKQRLLAGDILVFQNFGRYNEQLITDFHLLKLPEYRYIR
jgi:ornithine decarboxylase